MHAPALLKPLLQTENGADLASLLDVVRAAISDLKKAGDFIKDGSLCADDRSAAIEAGRCVQQAALKLNTWFPADDVCRLDLTTSDFEALREWPWATAFRYLPGALDRLVWKIQVLDEQILLAENIEMVAATTTLAGALGDDFQVNLRRSTNGPVIVVYHLDDDMPEMVSIVRTANGYGFAEPGTNVVSVGSLNDTLVQAVEAALSRSVDMRVSAMKASM